jgi:hypothetical protein
MFLESSIYVYKNLPLDPILSQMKPNRILPFICMRMFENRVLRIFRPKRSKRMGGWRKLHNEDLHNIYFWPDIITVFKSRKVRWAGYVARMTAFR